MSDQIANLDDYLGANISATSSSKRSEAYREVIK